MSKNKPHVSHNSGNMEWITPPNIVEAASRWMQGIDIDIASSPEANALHKIPTYYTKSNSAFDPLNPWYGSVYINPPYNRGVIDGFALELHQKLTYGDVKRATWLSNNATETKWCQLLVELKPYICFPYQRFKFLNNQLEPKGKPLQGQMIMGFSKWNEYNSFHEAFHNIGWIVSTMNGDLGRTVKAIEIE